MTYGNPGKGANTSKKLRRIRQATSAANSRYSQGGALKEKHPPRPITLPNAEAFAKLKP